MPKSIFDTTDILEKQQRQLLDACQEAWGGEIEVKIAPATRGQERMQVSIRNLTPKQQRNLEDNQKSSFLTIGSLVENLRFTRPHHQTGKVAMHFFMTTANFDKLVKELGKLSKKSGLSLY